MNTSTDSKATQHMSRLLAVTLMSLAAVALGTGCGEGLEEQAPLAQQQASMDRTPCPTGECDDPTNGQGIYVSEGSDYCIPMLGERNSFCPESFANLPGGGVELRGQRIYPSQGFPDKPIAVSLLADAWLDGQPVFVSSIDSREGRLIVTVRDATTSVVLEAADLDKLELGFPQGANQFRLKLHSVTLENDVEVFRADYSLGDTKVWQPYCDDGTGTASFLPSRSVHSVSALMTDDAATVTMACRTGAIATCMVWGYQPWKFGEKAELADYVYGSCLQAKRAAYFVGEGDFKSYTKGGTHFIVQDKYEIMNGLMPGVEAVWSPEGAVCFNPQFRRTPAPGSGQLPALPASYHVPLCDPSLDTAASQGLLPALLLEEAPLVTGPVI